MSMITTVNKNHHELAGTMVDVALAQGHPRLKVAQLLADHDAAKDARITELVAEIKDARNAWIGDDFGHLPLKEAIGAMRENFESRAEAAEALVTEKDKALSVIAIDFERGGSSPDDTRGNHISRRHLVMHSLALTPAVLTSELERLRTQVEVKDKCNDEIHQSFGKENDELRQQLAAANAEVQRLKEQISKNQQLNRHNYESANKYLEESNTLRAKVAALVSAGDGIREAWRKAEEDDDMRVSFQAWDAAKQGVQAPSSTTPGDDAIATGGSL